MKKIKEQAEKAYFDFVQVRKDAIKCMKQGDCNETILNLQINKIIEEYKKEIIYSENEYDETCKCDIGFIAKSNKHVAFDTPRSAKLYDVLSEFIDHEKDSNMIYSIISLVEQYGELYEDENK